MKIAVLTSGGVDSSVALRLLKEEGHDVTAFYLKIWLEDELQYLGDCPWEEDLEYVRQICEELEVPLEIIPMQEEYWQKVVEYTMAESKAGRTPNPDVLCNRHIKFGGFFDRIDDSFEKVATGHYAWVEEKNGKFSLKKAPDPVKDQTYFLAKLSQKQLSRALFPIGKYKKAEVRELAEKFNLPNKNRKDSQGICFLGKIKYSEFLKHHLEEMPGDFIEKETGKRVGEHKGYWFYTIGQRMGLGLSGGPWFVIEKDIEKNVIYLAHGYDPDAVYGDHFLVGEMNWIGSVSEKSNPRSQIRDLKSLQVKVRHGSSAHPCIVEVLEDGKLEVRLLERVHGIAPGQFAVFYEQNECLGGGVII